MAYVYDDKTGEFKNVPETKHAHTSSSSNNNSDGDGCLSSIFGGVGMIFYILLEWGIPILIVIGLFKACD